MLGMQALVSLELVLGLGVWLALRVFVSWPSMSANCSLVLLLWWGFNYEQVKEVGLLEVRLVVGLVVGVSSQLRSLFTETILGLETGKTVWPGWIVQDRDLGDDWPLWWICIEHCGVFGRYMRLLLKCGIVLKGVPSGGTRVDPKWVKELQQEKAIELEVWKICFAGRTVTEVSADETAQKWQ